MRQLCGSKSVGLCVAWSPKSVPCCWLFWIPYLQRPVDVCRWCAAVPHTTTRYLAAILQWGSSAGVRVWFMRRLKPTECHMYLDGQQYHCYRWLCWTPLLHRWTYVSDGSSSEVRVWVCASPEARRVSHTVICISMGNSSTCFFAVGYFEYWYCTGDAPMFNTLPTSDTAMSQLCGSMSEGLSIA